MWPAKRGKAKNIFNTLGAWLLGQMNKLLVIRIYFNAVGAFGAHARHFHLCL